MSRTTLRIIIVLAGLSIVGITATQIYWVRRAFDLRENQFYHDVHGALANVAQKIYEINKTPSPANDPVSQLASNYFVVLVNGPIDASVLEFLLRTEFEKRNITSGFEYGVYDCSEKCMMGGAQLTPVKTGTPMRFPENPRLNVDGYYFAVQFPLLQANLISQMGIWGFSSVVMLVVIFFFVYTLFVILRQRRLSEVQRDFINNMTHEFKTPISTISISSEVLKDPAAQLTPDRIVNYATLIGQESRRLEQQVERVLQIASIEKDDIQLKLEAVDLHALITEVVKNCPSSLDKKANVTLDLRAQPAAVFVDKLHFTSVIHNLVDNAVKYSKQSPVISVSTQRHGNEISVVVTDNGIGLSPEEQRKIFHKFYRVPTGNLHDVKGFGLGLYYVKMIMEKHHGSVSVNSKPGEGSSFKLTLPAA